MVGLQNSWWDFSCRFAVDVAFGARVAGRHGVLALEVPPHAPHVPRDFAAQFALVARALDFLHVPLDEL